MNCKKCVFKVDGEKGQVGCEADRLQTFIDKGKAHPNSIAEAYNLDQFCNMYRSEETSLDKARDQVKPLFGVAIYDQTPASHFVGNNEMIAKIESSLNSVLKQAESYDEGKIKVIISTFTGHKTAQVADVVNRAKEKVSRVSATFHLLDNIPLRDYQIFKELIEGDYFVHMKAGAELPDTLFSQIDDSLNEKLEQVVIFEGKDWSIVRKNVAKMHYLDYNDYEQMIPFIRSNAIEQNVYKKII